MINWVWGQLSAFASLGVFAGFFVLSLIFIFVLFPMKIRGVDRPTLTASRL